MEDNTQSDFFLFLIRDLSSTETEISGNFVEMFLFFIIRCFTILFTRSVIIVRIGLPFYICAYKLSVLAQKQWNLFLETSLFKGLTSIQGSQKLVPEKRPHNHCIC